MVTWPWTKNLSTPPWHDDMPACHASSKPEKRKTSASGQWKLIDSVFWTHKLLLQFATVICIVCIHVDGFNWTVNALLMWIVQLMKILNNFWATVCKTVRPMLSVRCLSCLSVSDVRALWPNGKTDQDETWHADRPRPWPHCVRWGPAPPPKRGVKPSPQFSAHVYCDQTAGWMKLILGMG